MGRGGAREIDCSQLFWRGKMPLEIRYSSSRKSEECIKNIEERISTYELLGGTAQTFPRNSFPFRRMDFVFLLRASSRPFQK